MVGDNWCEVVHWRLIITPDGTANKKIIVDFMVSCEHNNYGCG